MSDKQFTIPEIKELMEAMNQNGLGLVKIEQNGCKLKLKSCRVEQVSLSKSAAMQTAQVEDGAAMVQVAQPAAQPDDGSQVVSSPIVGTFYAAPAPDQDPFVKVGSQVQKGDVLFIIESMKLMNEVTSELDGTISEILVDNGQGVEYGQPILKIK